MEETKTGAEPGAPYGLGRMLQDTVTAPLWPRAVFTALADRPAPSYGVMIANLLAFCAAAYAAAIFQAGAALPGFLPEAPLSLALALAAVMALTVPFSFIAAGVLHTFMLLCGGEGNFQRSYQALSLLSLAAALEAILISFDPLWLLPWLLAAFLAAAAARTLHRAPVLRAAAVFVLLAAFGAGGQWWAQQRLIPLVRTARVFSAATAAAQAMAPRAPLLAAPATPAAPSPASAGSLDLIAPFHEGTSAPAAQAAPELQAKAEAVQRATADMLGPVMGLLNDPSLTKNLPPEQAKSMAALAGMMKDMQAAMAGGKNISPQERDAMRIRLQTIMPQLMKQMPAPAQPAAGSPGQQP